MFPSKYFMTIYDQKIRQFLLDMTSEEKIRKIRPISIY